MYRAQVVKKETVERRRIEILEATCDVVIERGFAGTRVADVAKKLGVSNSLIHYHFASKEELLAAAFEHYARKDLVDMQRDSDSAPTSVAKLWRLIESYVPEGSDDVEWMIWIDAWGEALRNPKMKPISQELDEQSIAVFEKTLRAGNESGEFHCVHPRESATRISGLIDGLAVQYAAHEGVLKRKEFIRLMRQLAASKLDYPLTTFEIHVVHPNRIMVKKVARTTKVLVLLRLRLNSTFDNCSTITQMPLAAMTL